MPDPDSFTRDAYSIEIFESEAELNAFSRTMLSTLAEAGITDVTLVLPGAIAGLA